MHHICFSVNFTKRNLSRQRPVEPVQRESVANTLLMTEAAEPFVFCSRTCELHRAEVSMSGKSGSPAHILTKEGIEKFLHLDVAANCSIHTLLCDSCKMGVGKSVSLV